MNALEVMTSHKTDKWNTPKEVVADVIYNSILNNRSANA